jgi:glycolate oxidase FAD binding subunit
MTAVSGRGETFKSGGRVVKNVTGYDLCKLIAGSWGTLAVMTEVTLKVLPRAEATATVIVLGLDPAAAVAAMTQALGSACDVSAAAHLPAAVAARVPAVAKVGGAVTALRLEGVLPSVAHRRSVLERLLRPAGSLAALDAAESVAFWRAVREVAPFAGGEGSDDPVLWRISTAPALGAEIAACLRVETGAELMFDWGGGLIWATLPPAGDAGVGVVRDALGRHGGHATLIRAPAAVRAAVEVFQPQETDVAALTRRVKESFDPHRLLNPGRMWAGV